jgi:ribosomal protein S18 acetylase RimI-like enzyme
MAERPTIRRGGPGDAETIGSMLHAFNTEYEEATPDAEELARHARPLLESGEMTALFAGDGPDGFCLFRLQRSLYTGRPDAYIQELWVVPERRGLGLGRALLEAALAAAREAGATHVELNTSEDDREARSLYESTGFTNREGGEDGPSMLYYERDL